MCDDCTAIGCRYPDRHCGCGCHYRSYYVYIREWYRPEDICPRCGEPNIDAGGCACCCNPGA